MAIQFKCPACEQPIEIDDEHGGREVSCPYCHNVISAPTASTLNIGSGSTADEAAQVPPVPPRSPHSGPVPPPGQAPPTVDLSAGAQRAPWPMSQAPPVPLVHPPSGRNLPGIAGVICGMLALGMLLPFTVLAAGHHEEMGMPLEGRIDQAEMQKRMTELLEDPGKHSWFMAMIGCMVAAGVFWVTGLILSAVGMSKRYRSRASAIGGLIVAMVLPLLICSGLSIQ